MFAVENFTGIVYTVQHVSGAPCMSVPFAVSSNK